MKCSNCGKEMHKNQKFCSGCGQKIENEETDKVKKGNNKIYILIVVAFIIVCSIVSVILFTSKDVVLPKKENTETKKEDIKANDIKNISFANMNADDENLDKNQQEIVNYFDNDYLWANVANLQKYPQIFKNTKIRTIAGVVKILKSTENEFEALMYEDEFGYWFGPNTTGQFSLAEAAPNTLFILKGEQLNERLTAYDYIEIRGRHIDVETREIDGISYTIPVISSININKPGEDIYSISTIRTVAEHIFGKDIKITTADDIEHKFGYYTYTEKPSYYLVTLDNQSNANFKAFNISKNEGMITYNEEHNDVPESVVKKLFISSDFNHFIVTTYDSSLKYVYIDYFDKQLNKLWGREFQYNSNDLSNLSPMDYNLNQMAIVVDNDLYLIDLNTGENIIQQMLVGEKTKVIMMDDGIILIGTENKDLIMKVDFKGNILYRINGDTELTSIYSTESQIVDGKLLINVKGSNENADPDSMMEYDIEKYMVITNDGQVEYSTKDIGTYMG